MLIKCGMLVLAIGATACGLLTLRQSRLQAASELAQSQIRIGKSDERLWALRSQIASRVTPANVERMAQDLGPLSPIIAPPVALPQPGAALPVLAQAETPRLAPTPDSGVRVVVNTATSKASLPAPTDGVGLLAKAERAKPSAPDTKPDPKTSAKAQTKPGAKGGVKPGVKPDGKPAPKVKKPSLPPDTLLRAHAKTTPTRLAKASKPAAHSGPLGKSIKPVKSGTPEGGTQLAMQTGRQ